MKSGFVGLIGRPNVGKSTLLNNILGKKVAITSDKPQTTRNIIKGIYNDDEAQIVFVDTPGIHKPQSKLGSYLNKQAYYSLDDVDVAIMIVDASSELGSGDKYIIDRIKEVNKPVILLLNKIDKMVKEKILLKIDEYKDLYDFVEIIPISGLKGDNVDTLINVCKKYLTDEFKYYEDGQFTNKSIDFLISEIIREKVFELTTEEVPHSVACKLEKITKHNGTYNIMGTIIVDRDALKRIIIGKNGRMIKEIGIRSRGEIEKLLGSKVYLELLVKTIKKWRESDKYLSEFGYNEFE